MDKLNKKSVRKLLESRFERDCFTKLSLFPSPFLFKDIEKAALRVKNAIENNEKIVIVGDYDVDGVVSSVILSEFFDEFGVNYETIIPNRFTDGYGLNPAILEKIEATVVITVDNGISALKAAQTCIEKNIDLIITDHHAPPSILPNAYAIINPKQSDCKFPVSEICGAQVAWYFIAAIKELCGFDYDLKKHLDLLAIAIIADMMDLCDINRTMVKSGLKLLNISSRPAFKAIKVMFEKDAFENDDISFLLAPLLNSSGRMENASSSYDFLKAKTTSSALIQLENIVELNNKRKIEEKILFENSIELINENDKIIVVWGEHWHEGVVGIVASRLCKKYKKPAIVFSLNGDRAKGSARSILGLDILSLISKHEEILLSFGGHFGAAGVLLLRENLIKFKNDISSSMSSTCIDEKYLCDDILGELDIMDIDFELLKVLEEFEPYGQKNAKPYFLLKDLNVKILKQLGKSGEHLKLILQLNDICVESIFFNSNANIKKGDDIDIICSVVRNNFRGLVTPQLMIREVLKVSR